MTNRTRAAAAAALSTAAMLYLSVETAAGGGAFLSPVRDRYEPGDVATLVAYTGGPQMVEIRGGPYRAFLAPDPSGPEVEVGVLELTSTGRSGWEAFRVAVTFTIPPDAAPGQYFVSYCGEPCNRSEFLGDIVGGLLSVGVDPPFPITRPWPLDEPEIANLPDDAVLSGPGYEVTAAEVRAGYVPPRVGPGPQPPSVTAPSTAPLATGPVATALPPATAPPATAAPSSQPPWFLFLTGALVAAGAAAVAVRRRRWPRRSPAPPRNDELVLTYEPADWEDVGVRS